MNILRVLTLTLLLLTGAASAEVAPPGLWNQGINHQYFSGHIPANTIVEYDANLPDNIEALTTKPKDDQFRIALNPKYMKSKNYMRLVLVHEDCHVITWSEFDQHGPKWKACMAIVAAQGVYLDVMLEGY